MHVVLDANVAISMLIKPGKAVELLFQSELEIFAPELLFKEIERNKLTIIKKSKLTRAEVELFLQILKNNVTLIPEEEFVKQLPEAERICPDEKDIIYFMLALHLKCAIWTNEKKLKNQDQVVVYKTHELIHLFLPK